MNAEHPSARRRPALTLASLALAVVLGGMLAACGDTPPPAPPLPDLVVTVTANDDMKYDTETIKAKPGQSVVITLKNIGSAPKFSMGHNLVVLNRGIDAMKFIVAGAEHAGKGYIDPALVGSVVVASKLLGPGESDTLRFKAPLVPGAYDFVCTFPGHYAVGMKGQLVVAP